MKKSKSQEVDLSLCVLNDGQVDWLPRNPRPSRKEDIERTMKSIREDEDFLEDRPVLVVPDDGYLVVFAGNLRATAAKKIGLKTIPAVIYTPETDEDRETIKRRAIKDNGSFGTWDYDILANEWDDLDLGEWGVSAWSMPNFAPNLNPVDGVDPVTDDDIEKAKEELAEEVVPTEKQTIEIICPHCGQTFTFKI